MEFHILFLKNKKGLSQVIGTLVLILVSLVAVALIWYAIDSTLLERLRGTEGCYNLFEKAEINNDWTCYNDSADIVFVSLSIKDLNLDGMLVAVSGNSSSRIRTINNKSTVVDNVVSYDGSGETVSLPGKYSGKTYNFTNITFKPIRIEIAPIVGGKTCDIIDSMSDIPKC